MNVLVLGKIHKSGMSMFDSVPGLAVTNVDPADRATIETAVRSADAVLIRTMEFGADLIARAERLKVISRYGVGVDNLDVDALTKRGVPVTVIGQENAVSVAEHTLYLMLATIKQGLAHDRAVRSGSWSFRDAGASSELSGKRLLIVGLGKIGRRVATLAEAFEMSVSFFDPAITGDGVGQNWRRFTELESALRDADIVSVHSPLLPATRGLIGRRALAQMKPSAVVISTARGGVVDEAALAEALSNGTVRGAALDVFEQEPPLSDNPLLTLENVILSPHIGALSREGVERMSVRAAQNCLDGLTGQLDPSFVINLTKLQELGFQINGQRK